MCHCASPAEAPGPCRLLPPKQTARAAVRGGATTANGYGGSAQANGGGGGTQGRDPSPPRSCQAGGGGGEGGGGAELARLLGEGGHRPLLL